MWQQTRPPSCGALAIMGRPDPKRPWRAPPSQCPGGRILGGKIAVTTLFPVKSVKDRLRACPRAQVSRPCGWGLAGGSPLPGCVRPLVSVRWGTSQSGLVHHAAEKLPSGSRVEAGLAQLCPEPSTGCRVLSWSTWCCRCFEPAVSGAVGHLHKDDFPGRGTGPQFIAALGGVPVAVTSPAGGNNRPG